MEEQKASWESEGLQMSNRDGNRKKEKKRKEKRAGLCQDLASVRRIVLDVFQVTLTVGGQFWAMVTKSHEVLAGNDMEWHAMACNRMALHNEPRLARPSGRKAGGQLVMDELVIS
jgi:hypothetical protein